MKKLPGVRLVEAFSTTCAVHIEEGVWSEQYNSLTFLSVRTKSFAQV